MGLSTYNRFNTKTMKKLLLLLVLLISNVAVAADIALSACYNNYWSSWEDAYHVGLYGSYSGFSISYSGQQHWNWYFRFQISNYRVPTKDEMKNYKKNDQWIEYKGTVEYYVIESYPTIEDVIRNSGVRLIPPEGSERRVKRTANARIRIKPYKKRPEVYNIFFDGVGYAIDLKGCKWDKNQ